jgi:ADP-ribose pyrophosphatase YjhB (NUDIX family)
MKLPRRKVARAFIFDINQKLFLIVKGSLPPFMYHLPGGGIGKNESAENAVRREIEEELNIKPNNISSVSFLYKVNTTVLCIPHEMDIFLIQVMNFDLKLSWEISSSKWVTFEELKKELDKDSLLGIDNLSYLVN